jgi:glycosyltransferase involved in cell wall biosynthesis
MPAVSTTLGAEGLTSADGELCALADEPAVFAGKIVDLFRDPERAAAMAARARREAETVWDIRAATGRLVESYREALREKRGSAGAGARVPMVAAGSRR